MSGMRKRSARGRAETIRPDDRDGRWRPMGPGWPGRSGPLAGACSRAGVLPTIVRRGPGFACAVVKVSGRCDAGSMGKSASAWAFRRRPSTLRRGRAPLRPGGPARRAASDHVAREDAHADAAQSRHHAPAERAPDHQQVNITGTGCSRPEPTRRTPTGASPAPVPPPEGIGQVSAAPVAALYAASQRIFAGRRDRRGPAAAGRPGEAAPARAEGGRSTARRPRTMRFSWSRRRSA